jgi:hypothetical protein
MNKTKYAIVLGLHPTTAGMGWVVATSPLGLVDWGVIRARGDKNTVCLKRVSELLDTYAPEAVVLRHPAGSSRRRVMRVARLVTAVTGLAQNRGSDVTLIAKREVKRIFARFGVSTRHEIAEFLAANIDALASRLPPRRKPWMREDERLGLFDAAALMVCHFVTRDLDQDPFPNRTTS